MKNKTSLVLVEMALMLLVFAVTVTICLKAFVWSYRSSESDRDKNEAVILLQNTAELIKHSSGDFSELEKKLRGESDGEEYVVFYSEKWEAVEDGGKFFMSITPLKSENSLLGGYYIEISETDGEAIVSSEVYYQEGVK